MGEYPYYYYGDDFEIPFEVTQFLIYITVILGIIALLSLIFYIICFWKIFKKAGRGGWTALIPFYNTWSLYEIATGHGWFMFLLFIPIANLVALIYLTVKLSTAFGKDEVYCLGLIFLPIIFIPILAFGNAQYVPPADKKNAYAYQGGYYQPYGAPYANQGSQYGASYSNQGQQYSGSYTQCQQPLQQGSFCPNCGTRSNGGRFCSNCGFDIMNNR